MANEDSTNKNGTGGEGGAGGASDGDKRMTADEIAAAAAAAKKLLDDEKKAGGEGADKSVVDDDPNKGGDRSNVDIEKTLDYVDKLKDENAKRRIDNKKLNERLDKTEQQLAQAAKALEEATSRIKEVDEKSEAQKAKERTDLENANKKLEDLMKTVDELKGELTESKQATEVANRRVALVNRETMIERLVEQQGARFASDFERDGLIANLTKQDSAGNFEKNNDEVVYEVMKFIETAPKAGEGGDGENLNVPPAGPGGRKSQTPVGDEIQSLLAKKARLSPEENTRLKELLKMSSEAKLAMNPRRR
jgi:DNA repair exonuclease SbcCD ATPase subunit